MSFDEKITFTKENLDTYFKALAKEYRKQGGGRAPTDIILVGGAAIAEIYGFRDMTTDVDAVFNSQSLLKEAIRKVADENGLRNDWLNFDFKMTDSYSPEIRKYSKPYKNFYNVLTVRTLSAEYLIAMKLTALREYKNDMSDIVGILWEHNKNGNPITFEMIDTAMTNLYGGWAKCKDNAKPFIESVFAASDFERLYNEMRNNEIATKHALLEFQTEHPDELTEASISDIIKNARESKERKQSVLKHLEELREKQQANDDNNKAPIVKKTAIARK